MKRFASIDFLRGLAIFIMLFLHMLMHTLDVDTLTADMTALTFFELLLLVILPFMGGLAGFFLMVSAMGNAVSMEAQLQKGMAYSELGRRQIIGGFILLFFAMLVEGFIGYHGALGDTIHHALRAASDPTVAAQGWVWDRALFRFNHMETIHTIAWCIILNGLIHARLSRDPVNMDKRRMIKKYIFLIVAVLVMTPVIWGLVNIIIPNFPMQTGDYLSSYPKIGNDPLWKFFLVFILEPLAGHPEPIFPYLAVSFMGSIFGIFLTMPAEQRPAYFSRTVNRIGMVMFFTGLAGVVLNLAAVVAQSGLDSGLALYMHIWDHRGWTPNLLGAPYMGWYFQFMILNGFALCLVNIVIRLVEMRGRGAKFGKRTTYIRRFGFLAFTNYTMQYIYFVAMFVSMDWIFGGVYERNSVMWPAAIVTLILGMTFYSVLLKLWEKVRYAGSLEWMVKQMNYILNPARRKELKSKGISAFEAGLLNVHGSFYNPKWSDLKNLSEVDHKSGSDSRLALKLGLIGFVFAPFAFLAQIITRQAVSDEGHLAVYKKARRRARNAVIFSVILLILLLILKPSMLG